MGIFAVHAGNHDRTSGARPDVTPGIDGFARLGAVTGDLQQGMDRSPELRARRTPAIKSAEDVEPPEGIFPEIQIGHRSWNSNPTR